jgi:hypothetical protein
MLPTLIVILFMTPAAMFVSHAITYRLMRALDKRPTAHTSAIVALAGWLVALLAIAAALAWRARMDQPLTIVCLFVYVVAVYGALGILYLDVVNIAETSLHMHLLLEIAWSDRPSLAALIERYSPDRMVAERLDRLTALGQVRAVDGRYYLGSRSALRLATCVDAWRRILGLPTSPDEGVPSDRI